MKMMVCGSKSSGEDGRFVGREEEIVGSGPSFVLRVMLSWGRWEVDGGVVRK